MYKDSVQYLRMEGRARNYIHNNKFISKYYLKILTGHRVDRPLPVMESMFLPPQSSTNIYNTG